MVSHVQGVAPEDLRPGLAVEVIFEAITPEITLPKFRPIA